MVQYSVQGERGATKNINLSNVSLLSPVVDDASPIVDYSGEWSTTPPEGAPSLSQYHVRAVLVFSTILRSSYSRPTGWNGPFNDRECTVCPWYYEH